jgi:hypothetical protein
VLGRWKEWLKQCPFLVAQIRRVGFACCCFHTPSLNHLLPYCQRC